MLSDSVYECIQNLLKDIKRYHEVPFNYSMNFRTEFIDALTHLYYIMFRSDDPNLDRYKKVKVMEDARKEAVYRIDRIRRGLDPYEE